MSRLTLDIATVTTSTTITKAGFAATVSSLSSTGTVHAELYTLSGNKDQQKNLVVSEILFVIGWI
jgi:hypothetical protein